MKNRCDELREPGFIQIVVSILILVGLLISYLPQMIRIISRGTSEGISPYFILLGTTSATCGFANILLLKESRQDIGCCKELETFHCLAGLLGIAQLGVQLGCFWFIFVLFLVFFRYNTSNVPDEELGGEAPRWQTALLVAVVTLVHALVVIIVSAILTYISPDKLDIWAPILGMTGAALAAIQYFPQIWTTYNLKHVGSLSIPMMCIQTPGGFLFAGSLMARLGWGGWSSWGIFLLTATMQGILLSLAIYYEIQCARRIEATMAVRLVGMRTADQGRRIVRRITQGPMALTTICQALIPATRSTMQITKKTWLVSWTVKKPMLLQTRHHYYVVGF